MKDKLKKLMKEPVEHCRRNMRWDGENDAVIEEILELVNNKAKRAKNDNTKRGAKRYARTYTQLGQAK